ncbi:hypothetical protein PhaeoP18_00419 [Phaeobacter piscinae]|uniref:Uncharacterized protein n=1 Tax=Phaeobacter piscinae TaxID=1580596 RepID=A0AAN1GNP5_9RHOB|nr:hypothetical protein PhaeoP13_00418 [Phaeobacter piscinae]AUR34716.1 hypothetical protein PhaeoP18_00419 [Phaeobacter piscinae]
MKAASGGGSVMLNRLWWVVSISEICGLNGWMV